MVPSQGTLLCSMCQNEEDDGEEDEDDDEEGEEGDYFEGDEGDEFDDEGDESDNLQTSMQRRGRYTCKCGGWCFIDQGKRVCVLCSK